MAASPKRATACFVCSSKDHSGWNCPNRVTKDKGDAKAGKKGRAIFGAAPTATSSAPLTPPVVATSSVVLEGQRIGDGTRPVRVALDASISNAIVRKVPKCLTEADLVALLADKVTIISTKIMRNRSSNASLGYGFVAIKGKAGQLRAVLHGKYVCKRSVPEGDRTDRPPSSLYFLADTQPTSTDPSASIVSKVPLVVEAAKRSMVSDAAQVDAARARALLAHEAPTLLATPAVAKTEPDLRDAALATVDPTNLLLRGLPLAYEEADVRALLAPFGVVTECSVWRGRSDKQSRGIAIARLDTQEAAAAAIAGLTGTVLDSTLLDIRLRRPRTTTASTNGKSPRSRAVWSPSAPDFVPSFAFSPALTWDSPGRSQASPSHASRHSSVASSPRQPSATPRTPRSGGSATKATPSRSVFVVNLPEAMDEASFARLFAPFGELVNVAIPRGPDGAVKGFGYVNFTSIAAATSAIAAMDWLDVGSKKIRVKYARTESAPGAKSPSVVAKPLFPGVTQSGSPIARTASPPPRPVSPLAANSLRKASADRGSRAEASTDWRARQPPPEKARLLRAKSAEHVPFRDLGAGDSREALLDPSPGLSASAKTAIHSPVAKTAAGASDGGPARLHAMVRKSMQ